MSKKKKKPKTDPRNWLAVSAWFRTSKGAMLDKKKYNRRKKHKEKEDG